MPRPHPIDHSPRDLGALSRNATVAVALAAIVVVGVVYVELRGAGDRAVLPSQEEESIAPTSLDRAPIDFPTATAGDNPDPAALPTTIGRTEPPFDSDQPLPKRRAASAGIWRFGPVPPGMVLVPGGETAIGTPPDELNELLEQHPALQRNASALLAEIPRHAVHVEDFYLMTTEVTNEQYLAYVEATGARPPHHWSQEALDQARREHLLTEEEREGVAPEPLEGDEFGEASWWAENWQDCEYEMPEELAAIPVVSVDHQEARAYAQWAGLRLPTEEEFERAVRGNTERSYPWEGPFVIGKHAATNEGDQAGELFPVGSFPDGATEYGVFDLAGNAWEWTDSRYLAYPGWEHQSLGRAKRDRKAVPTPLPHWNRHFRVVKGGSKQNSHPYSRCTTRGGFDREQRASALGFRCALSVQPGLDLARHQLEELPAWVVGAKQDNPIDLDFEQAAIRHRWSFARGTADVPSYEVITDYEHILFVPARDAQIEGYPLVGCLSTSLDVLEPKLSPGRYLLVTSGYFFRRGAELDFDRIHVFDWAGDRVASLWISDTYRGDELEDAAEWMQLRITVTGAKGQDRVVRTYLRF